MSDTGNAGSSAAHLTELLHRWSAGDRAALDELFPEAHRELERLAAHHIRREGRDHTLEVGGLVNEAFLRLTDQQRVTWVDRAHFFAIASQLMRRILVDYARRHRAAKRGGGLQHLTLSGVRAQGSTPDVDAIWLHRAVDELHHLAPRQATVVELRYFGGLSIEEAAEALGLSPATVKREWMAARAWLAYRLKESPTKP